LILPTLYISKSSKLEQEIRLMWDRMTAAFSSAWARLREQFEIWVRDVLSRIWCMESEPVVAPPTELAANGPEREHAEQAVERAQLSRLELH
jgi:hypothetical protein